MMEKNDGIDSKVLKGKTIVLGITEDAICRDVVVSRMKEEIKKMGIEIIILPNSSQVSNFALLPLLVRDFDLPEVKEDVGGAKSYSDIGKRRKKGRITRF